MKKLQWAFLTALLLLGGMTVCAAEPEEWTAVGGVITAWKGRETSVEVPASWAGEPVTAIGAEVFAGAKDVTDIALPETVERIGERAFADSGVTYLAISGCELPEMAANALEGTALENVDIGSGATKEQMLQAQRFLDGLGQRARVWRMQNPEVDYTRDNLSTYEDGLMTGYTGTMTHIRPWNGVKLDPEAEAVPVTGIADGALKGNAVVTYFSVPYNEVFTYVGAEAFMDSAVETVDLFDSVTTIGERAFAGCAHLKELRMREGVRTIGEEAFAGCEALTEITLPDTLEELGQLAFSGCRGLTRVTVLCDPDILPEDAFMDCPSLAELSLGEAAPEGERERLAARLGISLPVPETEETEIPESEPEAIEELVEQHYEPVPVVPAKSLSDFDGVWSAVAVEFDGKCRPVSEETQALEKLLGVSRFELTIEQGQVQWLGQLEPEHFSFVRGRLQMLERGVRNIETGTLDQFIELREDGSLSFSALKMTFYCEKILENGGNEG